MSEHHKEELEKQLWNIADTLRGKMNADEFRDYILGFIFYKYLSERMLLFANKELVEDKLEYEKLDDTRHADIIEAVKEAALESLGYFLKPDDLFSRIAAKGASESDGTASNFILGDLSRILSDIEKSTMGTDSEDDFDNLFEDLSLDSTKLGKTVADRNEIIARVLAHLDKIDFKLEHTDIDVLGDAYEYLIGEFAAGAGKKAGEFYTPQAVSKVLARLVTSGKTRIRNVYDPTCGSGSLLLRVAREMDENTRKNIEFYGQEMNRTTYNLARMNMILHDVHYSRFDIKQEDTLLRPQHADMRFEAIVANPPFSALWKADPTMLSDDRFSQYGRLAPGSKADFAFVQHMVHQLAENGQMAVVLPHGVLFRGGAEGHIRQFLVETLNVLDAVIGLPANIFYGTSIPTCILVIKKCREQPDNILFIDASQYFEKVKNQNKLREAEIDRIVDTYRTRTNVEKYSAVATIADIRANEYNLNIPRYVDTFEAEDAINLDATAAELRQLDADMIRTNARIAAFCRELGISSPF
jgi:type I restriction enzyme M protein